MENRMMKFMEFILSGLMIILLMLVLFLVWLFDGIENIGKNKYLSPEEIERMKWKGNL